MNENPMTPMQVTPVYRSSDAGDCHVHHGDGVVAVLVGLTNAEAASAIFTRLVSDPSGRGRATWLTSSISEPIAGALVGSVTDDDTLELSWWGRVDVHIPTAYGYETHTGGEDIRSVTTSSASAVRVVPRPVHGSHGASLGRGTIMAAGADISITPHPTTPDVMIEASSTSLPAVPEPVTGPGAADAAEAAPDVTEPPVEPAPADPAPVDPARDEPQPVDTAAVDVGAAPEPADEPTSEDAAPTVIEAVVAQPDVAVDAIGPVPAAATGAAASDPISARGVEMVRGLRCRNGHHNHPRARLCSLCGDAMQNVSIFLGADGELGEMGERPPLGIVTLDDGHAYQIGHDTLIGRMPTQPNPSTMVIAFPDDETMSREHVAIDLDGWNVFIRDLGSSNGTGVRFPDSPTYVRLEPDARYPLPSNSVIVIGRRWATFTATSAAPTHLGP